MILFLNYLQYSIREKYLKKYVLSIIFIKENHLNPTDEKKILSFNSRNPVLSSIIFSRVRNLIIVKINPSIKIFTAYCRLGLKNHIKIS